MSDFTAHDIHLLDQAYPDALADIERHTGDPNQKRALADKGPEVYAAELTRNLAHAASPMSLAGWAAIATVRLMEAGQAWEEDTDAAWAKVDELTAELEKVRAQLTDANRALDGYKADERSLTAANTALANENAELKRQLGKPTEQQYLIWSHKQDAWWGPGGHGYRWDICRAGRFPLDRANDHASTRSWPADRKTPPEVVIPAPPLDVLADPERIGDWIDEQIKAATDAKIAARDAEKAVAR